VSPDGFWMLILCHFAGDYLLQNDYQAKNKKAVGVFGLAVCSFHVLLYSIPFAFTGLLWWQVGLIFVQHLIQDRTRFVVWFMRVIGKREFLQPPFAPWSIILIDNLLHILWIAVVAKSGEWV